MTRRVWAWLAGIIAAGFLFAPPAGMTSDCCAQPQQEPPRASLLPPGRKPPQQVAPTQDASPQSGSRQTEPRQQPPPLVLDESRQEPRVEVLDEREADRREALTLFGVGRMRANENDLEGAVRVLERAYRLDPSGEAILDQILPVVFQLDRPGEAVRYALRQVQVSKDANPLLAQFLADHFVQQGDFHQALALYERMDELTPASDRRSESYVRARLVMGRLYHAEGRDEEAAKAFETMLQVRQSPADFGFSPEEANQLLGDVSDTLQLIGESLLNAGQVERAAALFEEAFAQQATNNDPNAAALRDFRTAQVAHAGGKTEEALVKLNAYLAAVSPAHEEALDLLKALLIEAGQGTDYLAQLQGWVDAKPQDAFLAIHLANELQKDGKLDEAAAVLEKCSQGLTGNADGNKFDRMTILAALINLHGKRTDAPAYFAAWSQLKELSDAPDAFVEAAMLELRDRPEFIAEIFAAAQAAAESHELSYGETLAAATLALHGKALDKAEAFMTRAIKLHPKLKADLLLFWGIRLMVEQQYAPAAEVFRRGIRENALPFGQPDFYYHLAGVLTELGEYPQAISAGRRAAAMAADNPRILARLAWAQYRAGNEPAATEGYERIIRKFDSDYKSDDIRESVRQARLVLSSLEADRGDYPAAEEWLEQILDEFPDDEGAMNDLGYLWADQNKRLHRAHAMIRKAVEQEPENASYLDSLGWVLHRLGKDAEALTYLQKSVELRPEPDGVVLDHLGDAYLAVENIASARAAWQKAIDAFDQEREADKIQRVQAKLAQHSATN